MPKPSTSKSALSKCFLIVPAGNCLGDPVPLELHRQLPPVICFAEQHTDLTSKKAMSKFINDNYCPGDIVLVESVAAGESVKRYRLLRDDICVQGWEPVDFREHTPPTIFQNDRIKDRLNSILTSITEQLPKNLNYCAKDLPPLEDNLKEFESICDQLADYPGEVDSVRAGQFVKECYQKLKDKTLSNGVDPDELFHENHALTFLLSMCETVRILINLLDSSLYNRLNETDRKIIEERIPVRNASLCTEIQKCRAQNRRVFVIGGTNHLLKNPYRPMSLQPTDVQEELHRHPFVIFIPKHKLKQHHMGALKLQPGH